MSRDGYGSGVAELLTRIMRAPSLFYRERLTGVALTGVAMSGADRVDDAAWRRLPLTRRDDMLRDQLAHLPHGTRRFADAAAPVRAGTTGTGTALLVLTWSAADLARERAAGVRMLHRFGLRAGAPVANTLPGALATPGALLFGDVVEELGALDVPLGTIESDAAARQAWELFDRVQPATLIVDPASATRLFAAAPEGTRSWWRGIVWLRVDTSAPRQPVVPTAAGFAGWQRLWLAVPEATSFVASSCEVGRMHIDDEVLAEVVDDTTGGSVTGDQPGVLVLTPFGGDAALLRYRSAVRARRLSQSCACGGAGTSLELL